MKRDERLRVAEETVAITERGAYETNFGLKVNLRDQIQECVRQTKLYLPEELETIAAAETSQAGSCSTEFEIKNETSLEGAIRLTQSGLYKRIGVLNFASAKNPGGGFLKGSQAQEESLARSSALNASLNACGEYYAYHRASESLLYSDRIIYSPNCPVFRDDDGALLQSPYNVDFITCAAPNAGALKQNQPQSLPQVPRTLETRAGKVLAVAAHQKCDALVLGAWGCGVFKNDPELVAGTFRRWLRGTYSGRFKQVLFSVLDREMNSPTLKAFEAALG